MLAALLGQVNEVPSYPTDDLDFAIVAVGGAFIVLLLIKHWRDQ